MQLSAVNRSVADRLHSAAIQSAAPPAPRRRGDGADRGPRLGAVGAGVRRTALTLGALAQAEQVSAPTITRLDRRHGTRRPGAARAPTPARPCGVAAADRERRATAARRPPRRVAALEADLATLARRPSARRSPPRPRSSSGGAGAPAQRREPARRAGWHADRSPPGGTGPHDARCDRCASH